MRIEAVRLIEKRGGKSGLYRAAAISSMPLTPRVRRAERAIRTPARRRSAAP
jgi:hypothetical protein